MIRFIDTVILAHTKLRTHKVRTGLTLGVAGILFGLILGVIFAAQGVFDSVERFSEEGLADRAIVAVSKWSDAYYNQYEHAEDEDFIAEVKATQEALVVKKTAAAKKYNVPYDAKSEDPSPIIIDKETKKERISDDFMESSIVMQVVEKRSQAAHKPLDIKAFLTPYPSAKVLPGNAAVNTADGSIYFMREGREEAMRPESERKKSNGGQYGQFETSIQVLNDTITRPFVTIDAFDYDKGEIPGVVSYSHAEELLGLKKLPKASTNQEKLDRLAEVRQRLPEVTASFCYRNSTSQALLSTAMAQQKEIERNKNNKDYVMPSIIYTIPDDTSCGAVTIEKDTRTPAEKRQADALVSYQKEIGEYPGEPEQQKVIMRAIGLSGDAPTDQIAGSAGAMVTGLLGSWLSYGNNWTIPNAMLARVPESLRPTTLFPDPNDEKGRNEALGKMIHIESYLVEFSDMQEAREVLERGGIFGGPMIDNTLSVAPFGSGTLMVHEVKRWFEIGLLWALAIVGGVAFIILAGLIGRMVSDGRRESAVFRAIGARRIDIGRIYSMYTLLLALRVVIFAVVLALVVAFAVDLWLSADATTAARLAYAAVDTTKEFHFISIWTWYVPAILGAIVVVSLLASIIPILLGARRNPITDMRNDT